MEQLEALLQSKKSTTRSTLMITLIGIVMQINSNNELIPLQIPAIRARMGVQIYYVTVLKIRDVAERFNVDQGKDLNKIPQQESQERCSNEVRDYYLLTEFQRFYNSLVIEVCSGSPKWFELDIRDNNLFSSEDLSPHIDGMLGILYFDGSERLFINRQCDAIGMLQTLEKNQDLGDEEISAIFVSCRNQCEV
jgi:DNA sulfur modification protein DndB